ncbi:hypothetical protein TNCV_2870661 [Trichonephila clavipes]|nr:hypothetical protein TNCV_2870661 [Trichonephila clavipes]
MDNSQSLGNHGLCFLLARYFMDALARATAEHFTYQGRSAQYQNHAVVHYLAEAGFGRARIKGRAPGRNAPEICALLKRPSMGKRGD